MAVCDPTPSSGCRGEREIEGRERRGRREGGEGEDECQCYSAMRCEEHQQKHLERKSETGEGVGEKEREYPMNLFLSCLPDREEAC